MKAYRTKGKEAELSLLVCVKCGRRLTRSCQGVWAQENVKKGGDASRLLMFDMWKCTKCGYEVLAGNGAPIYPHEREQFEKYQKETEVEFW